MSSQNGFQEFLSKLQEITLASLYKAKDGKFEVEYGACEKSKFRIRIETSASFQYYIMIEEIKKVLDEVKLQQLESDGFKSFIDGIKQIIAKSLYENGYGVISIEYRILRGNRNIYHIRISCPEYQNFFITDNELNEASKKVETKHVYELSLNA